MGACVLALTLSVCTAAGVMVTVRRFRGLAGAPAVMAAATVASAALVLAHLLPAVLGVLSRATVPAAALVALGLAALLARRSGTAGPAPAPGPASPAWSWLAAGAGLAVAGVWAIAHLAGDAAQPVIAIDALTGHLPQAARWIQTGSVWQLDQFTPDLSYATYPQNGNLMQLAAILPWHSTFAVRFVDAPFMALTAVGVYAIAVELRAPRATALLAAAAIVALPAIAKPALDQAQVDTPMLAWFTAGCLFLLRYARHRRTPELVLAGVGLGLAFGTKWYAPPDVVLVLVAFVLASLAGHRAWRALGRDTLILGGLIGVAGGFWLLRNWVEAGNPFQPAAVRLGGLTIFDAPVDDFRNRLGWTIADYGVNRAIWRDYFLPAFMRSWGWLAPAFGAGTLAAAAVALRLARRREDAAEALRVAAVAGAALAMAVVYVKLPYTAFGPHGRPVLVIANTRYLVPALLLGAAATAWLAGRVGRARPFVEAVLLIATIDAARRAFSPTPARTVVLVLVAVAAAGALAVLLTRAHGRTRLRIAGAVGVAALLLTAAAGARLRDRSGSGRYADGEPALAWIDAHRPAGARIALAGSWTAAGVPPVIGAFGPRLSNRVEALGHFEKGMLRRYGSARSFGAALRRGRYDTVLVGLTAPRELAWARRAGYALVARSNRFAVLTAPSPGLSEAPAMKVSVR